MTCKQGARDKLWEQMLQLLAYYLMLHMESRLLPVHRARMSPVNNLMSRTCLGTALLMSHCFM